LTRDETIISVKYGVTIAEIAARLGIYVAVLGANL
jgi:hypothetical protein